MLGGMFKNRLLRMNRGTHVETSKLGPYKGLTNQIVFHLSSSAVRIIIDFDKNSIFIVPVAACFEIVWHSFSMPFVVLLE